MNSVNNATLAGRTRRPTTTERVGESSASVSRTTFACPAFQHRDEELASIVPA
ncbi:MAG: hypothetical protein R2695_19915 [Acidimicrobiales bacterium]